MVQVFAMPLVAIAPLSLQSVSTVWNRYDFKATDRDRPQLTAQGASNAKKARSRHAQIIYRTLTLILFSGKGSSNLFTDQWGWHLVMSCWWRVVDL